jgi:hypothetical protein
MQFMARALLLISLLASAACGGATTPLPLATMTVLSPNGGESLLIGSNAIVSWAPGFIFSDVDIDLSTDGGATWVALASGVANDGPSHRRRELSLQMRVFAAHRDHPYQRPVLWEVRLVV